MTNQIEEINQVTERVKRCLTGADLPEGQYALLITDAFRSLIAANELLQQQNKQKDDKFFKQLEHEAFIDELF